MNKSNYVVLDVETNGLSSKRDDLLSISIFMPDKDKYFDRFLPLELSSFVITTYINGITKKMLKGKKPLSQEEFDLIVKDFELDKRTVLTYGKLDKFFIREYLKRHKIVGFDKINFLNIKDNIISTPYTRGILKKDNICNALGICGVSDIHSSHNDCLLEWKLFERMDEKKLFIKNTRKNWDIYEFSNDYIVPVSYIYTHPKIIKTLNLPNIELVSKTVFTYSFSKKFLSEYAQPAGVAVEHLIKSMLNTTEIDNSQFLIENNKKLKYIGCIETDNIKIIPFEGNRDGTIRAVNNEDKLFIDAINKQTKAIKKELGPAIKYIKEEVFKNEKILSQELIVNDKLKVLGKCDFSNAYACLEAKWSNFILINKRYFDEYKYQLYITANGRPCFIFVCLANKIEISKIDFIIK